MVEIIGLLAISALVWVLAWAMGAENSGADGKQRFSPQRPIGKDEVAQLARHAV